MVHFLDPGMVERCVLPHGTVAHAQAQARMCNMDLKYNHAYYITIQVIQDCERAVYDQNNT